MSNGHSANDAAAPGKQAAADFLANINDHADSIYWAAEEIFRDLAADDSGSWDGAYKVKLNPNELVILRLAGYVTGDDQKSSLTVKQQVGRVRNELEFRKVYRSKAELEDAKRVARETSERENAESAALQAQIAEAQAKLSALGKATADARAVVSKMLRAQEQLESLVPPYIQQAIDAARGNAKRSNAKKRLNELEGRLHALNEQERRIVDWERSQAEMASRSRSAHDAPTEMKPIPVLTNQMLNDKETLPRELEAARNAYETELREMKGLLSDFVEHGYRGPSA